MLTRKVVTEVRQVGQKVVPISALEIAEPPLLENSPSGAELRRRRMPKNPCCVDDHDLVLHHAYQANEAPTFLLVVAVMRCLLIAKYLL